LYEWTGSIYVLVPAAWYMLVTGSVAYEWDGNDWTGNSIIC
jgi:drug/metabolite transporter superfamily protein YnfA